MEHRDFCGVNHDNNCDGIYYYYYYCPTLQDCIPIYLNLIGSHHHAADQTRKLYTSLEMRVP